MIEIYSSKCGIYLHCTHLWLEVVKDFPVARPVMAFQASTSPFSSEQHYLMFTLLSNPRTVLKITFVCSNPFQVGLSCLRNIHLGAMIETTPLFEVEPRSVMLGFRSFPVSCVHYSVRSICKNDPVNPPSSWITIMIVAYSAFFWLSTCIYRGGEIWIAVASLLKLIISRASKGAVADWPRFLAVAVITTQAGSRLVPLRSPGFPLAYPGWGPSRLGASTYH